MPNRRRDILTEVDRETLGLALALLLLHAANEAVYADVVAVAAKLAVGGSMIAAILTINETLGPEPYIDVDLLQRTIAEGKRRAKQNPD